MSRWIEWVRKWAKDNNTTYGCALSEKDCSASYRAKYGISKKLPVKKEREMMGAEDVNRARKKPKKLPKNLIIYEEEEADEMDMMAKEDINRARKKPNREKKEAFSMASEDLLSKMTINKKTKKKPKKLPKNLIIYEEEEVNEMNMMAKEDINVARKKEILKKLSPLEKELKEINKKIENKKQFVEMSRMMGEDYNAPETYKTPVMVRKRKKKAPVPAPADEERGYILDEGTDSNFNRYWIIASPTQLRNQVVKETFFRIITAFKDNFKTNSAKTKLYNKIQKANAGEMAGLIKNYFNPNSPKRIDHFAEQRFLKDFFTKSTTKGDAIGTIAV